MQPIHPKENATKPPFAQEKKIHWEEVLLKVVKIELNTLGGVKWSMGLKCDSVL